MNGKDSNGRPAALRWAPVVAAALVAGFVVGLASAAMPLVYATLVGVVVGLVAGGIVFVLAKVLVGQGSG
jgi:fructose-specific phosphotransferase system IIC component